MPLTTPDTVAAWLAGRLLPLVTLRLELEASYRLSSNLMETYLGHDAANRELAGEADASGASAISTLILRGRSFS